MTKSKKKRIYSNTEYGDYLYSVDIGSMKISELKDYIRKASEQVVKGRNSDFDAVNTSYNYIANRFGTRRVRNPETGHYETKLTYRFNDKDKSDLVEMAYQLQGHIRIDAYTNEGKKRWRNIQQSTLDALEESTGVKLTKKQYNELRNVMAGIKDIVEKFGSDNVAKIYEYTTNHSNKGINLVNILRDAYESRGEAWDKDDFVQTAYDIINERIAEGGM